MYGKWRKVIKLTAPADITTKGEKILVVPKEFIENGPDISPK